MPKFQIDISRTRIDRYFITATDLEEAKLIARQGPIISSLFTKHSKATVNGVHEVSDELVKAFKTLPVAPIWYKKEVPFETA